MEFQLLLNQALNKNTEYNQLYQKLKDKQSRCLKNAVKQIQKTQCMSKRIHFNSYFEQYFDQFRQVIYSQTRKEEVCVQKSWANTEILKLRQNKKTNVSHFMPKVFIYFKKMQQISQKVWSKIQIFLNCDLSCQSVFKINIRYFMQGEQVSYQVVLPTSKGKLNLIAEGAKPQAQFLVGYRNILICKEESIQWGLIKSRLHCGRAFVFPIQQSKALAIQNLKNEDQIIETVSNTYIFVKKQKDIAKLTIKLKNQLIQILFQDLGGVNKINLNILKNAFDTYEEYRNSVDLETETSLNVEQNLKQLQLTQKVEIEYKSKTLSGNALKQLPLIPLDTGKWDGQKSIEIKILEN